MRADIRRAVEMLRRVRDFGESVSSDFPPTSLGGEQFGLVSSVVELLSRETALQESGRGTARQGTATRNHARTKLTGQLRAITRTARAIALDRPGIETRFRLQGNGGDETLLTTARAFAADAEPLKNEFVRYSLSGDFLDELKESIRQFEGAIDRQNAGREQHVSARVNIREAVELGINAVVRLNVIIHNRYHEDPAKLAAWESARHIERTPKAAKPNTDTNTPAGQAEAK